MIKLSFKKSSIRQEFMSSHPTLAGTLDAVGDEESPNSCEDDTSSESNDSDDS